MQPLGGLPSRREFAPGSLRGNFDTVNNYQAAELRIRPDHQYQGWSLHVQQPPQLQLLQIRLQLDKVVRATGAEFPLDDRYLQN